MPETKVVSIRVNKHIIDKLDELAKDLRWYKRNTIIEAILFHALNSLEKSEIRDLCRAPQCKTTNVKLNLEHVEREKNKPTPPE